MTTHPTTAAAQLHARGIPTRPFGVICPMCNMRFENCQCFVDGSEVDGELQPG